MDVAIAELKIEDPLVAGRLLMACSIAFGAFDDALIDTRDRMDDESWKLLRRAVGQVLGTDMGDLRSRLIAQHPQFDLPTAAEFVARYKEVH